MVQPSNIIISIVYIIVFYSVFLECTVAVDIAIFFELSICSRNILIKCHNTCRIG